LCTAPTGPIVTQWTVRLGDFSRRIR
jgi:hypothetical protein